MYFIKASAYTLVTILIVSCNLGKNEIQNATVGVDVLQSHIDTTVNPADDFFDYANGNWIKHNPIPADRLA